MGEAQAALRRLLQQNDLNESARVIYEKMLADIDAQIAAQQQLAQIQSSNAALQASADAGHKALRMYPQVTAAARWSIWRLEWIGLNHFEVSGFERQTEQDGGPRALAAVLGLLAGIDA